MQQLEQAVAGASNTEGDASDGEAAGVENVAPMAVSDALQRMWQASSDARHLKRQVCAGGTAPLLSIVSDASDCELLSSRGKASAKNVKLALLLLRRVCETRAGRRAVMLHNKAETEEGDGGGEGAGPGEGEDEDEGADEGEGGSAQGASDLSGPAILMQAVTHGMGKMRSLASEVIERLARSSAALDALFALGMQPALVSRTRSIRAAEIARISGRPVTFRVPKESAMAMAGDCLF